MREEQTVPEARSTFGHRLLNFELKPREAIGVVALVGAVSGLPFLAAGYPFYGDVWPHLARIRATYEAFQAGHLPGWSFFFYNGYPLLRFYSPLFFYLGGVISFVTGGDPFSAAKILLFVLQVGSGLTFYMFARRRLNDSAGALLASAGYMFSLWHMMYVNGMGRYPAALFFVVMPLTLWLLDRLFEKPDLTRALLLGLGLALLPLTHVFHAFFWIPFLLLWLVFDLAANPNSRGRKLGWSLAASGAAVLFSAFFAIPFLVEGVKYRMPQPVGPMPAPSLATIIGLQQAVSGYSGTYVGLSLVALAAAGIALLGRERGLARSPLFWGLVLSLLLAFNPYLPWLARLPMLGELAPERFLAFALLFLALLAGHGFRHLRAIVPLAWLWLPALTLVFLDLGPKALGSVYESGWEMLKNREYVYSKLAGRQDGKVIDLATEGTDMTRRFARYPASAFLFAHTPSVLGPPYHQFAPRSMLYSYAWINDIAGEFLDSTRDALSEQALRELRLLDARYLVTLPTRKTSAEGTIYVFLKRGLTWDDTLLRRLVAAEQAGGPDAETLETVYEPLAIGTLPGVSPVVVAPRVEPWPAPDSMVRLLTFYAASGWQGLPEAMALNYQTGTAERIFSVSGRDSILSDSLPECQVDRTRYDQDRVVIDFAVTQQCFARLALSYYPELRVKLDGQAVGFQETADHFLLIQVPAGRHRVTVEPASTPLRAFCSWLSLAALGLCLAALVGWHFARTESPGSKRG